MDPCVNGRHCNSCNKTVIDFTNKNITDLSNALLEEHGTICGRFTKSQTLTYKTKKWNFKKILASICIAIGIGSWYRELQAQHIVSDSLIDIGHDEKYDQLLNQDRYVLGVITSTMPIYKYGGEEGLYKFLGKNLKYPTNTLQGTVYVSFIVDTLGNVVDPIIKKSLSTEADNEVLRVVRMLAFNPGTEAGRKVQVKFMLPIKFSRKED